MASPDIFLSYNREDADVARRFADAFAAEGLNVWWDTALRSGEAYDEVTEAALRAAKAVVVLWSPRSVVSRWVRAEATIADRCKTLVPVTIEACERPIMFELTQTADLVHWTGDAGDRAWQAFLGDVRQFVGRDAVAAPIIEASEPAPAKPGKRGGAPSLAVLPFTNRSGLAEDEVFAFGMVEDLIDALSQGVNVRVLSSSATTRFSGGALPDLAALGQQLGVRYLLEGNVRRAGADLRVSVQLVEAASGEILWTQKFDRPLAELAALQEELVGEVAGTLKTQVYRIEIERVLRKPDDLTAWECLTRAVATYRNTSPTSVVEARDEAARAVAIAPDYGLAHAILAQNIGVLSWLHATRDSGEMQNVLKHVERALALDPDNGAVLAYVGSALGFIGHHEASLRYAGRAIQRSPQFGLAHLASGLACEGLGRIAEALAHYEDYRRLESQSHLEYIAAYNIGRAHLRGRDWHAADAAFAQSITLNDSSPLMPCLGALVASHLGRADDARAMLARSRRLGSTATLADWERRLNMWYAGSPVLDELLTLLRALWAESEGMV